MEKERLKYCIDRFDHYYDSVNNKSSVFLGLSTFIVGGLVAGYFLVDQYVDCGLWTHMLMIVLIGLGVANMIVVVTATTPFFGKDSDSLHFFGSIGCMEIGKFCLESEAMIDMDVELKDLRCQVHQLACGLKRKFNKLKIAGILFTIQFYLFLPLFINIICNLK
ncbi:hypothetical protein [Sphingobacterium prati]|uniref:hypothetical protein n=1 Tax=Sphingobacterium prati TaxID=2737006 RepID=UPI001557EEED|nr:hypothetical protein [Sphingobacterium prati]NPE46260.1 hypothetical protein [Sphingobacterium prati]